MQENKFNYAIAESLLGDNGVSSTKFPQEKDPRKYIELAKGVGIPEAEFLQTIELRQQHNWETRKENKQ